jgi:hypothetical protein
MFYFVPNIGRRISRMIDDAKQGDTLVVYMSGHGERYTATRRNHLANGAYLTRIEVITGSIIVKTFFA